MPDVRVYVVKLGPAGRVTFLGSCLIDESDAYPGAVIRRQEVPEPPPSAYGDAVRASDVFVVKAYTYEVIELRKDGRRIGVGVKISSEDGRPELLRGYRR